ncbi:MAG: heparan-alpha-glucosaminide N-acetyltransferase domain-containing protein [Culturomica sp.]|jgi:predicted acyltransferase|nr:heparan-alpha-glucosaminide N-acetyltransferase domain-containing protein [Culturomica sp.]
MEKISEKRLLSLDVLRGITIAGMILVNNAGNWNYVYAPLRHAGWDGLTPTDLVFPFFLFIMGISTFFSLQKYHFRANKALVYKIIRRTCVIFGLGLAIAWIGLCFRSHTLAGFSHLRIPGVLQRLAVTFCLASFVAIGIKHKYIPYITAFLLTGYALLMWLGNGTVSGENNLIGLTDKAILGSNHLHTPDFDPEGILSTVSALCNVLIGFLCGKMIRETNDAGKQITRLFVTGAALTFAGFLLSYGCPINKKIWSSTFVLVTCGMGATLLALLAWIIDAKGCKKWSRFFESFGVNPLFIYVFAEVFAIFLSGITFHYDDKTISVKHFVYREILEPCFGAYGGSFAYSILFVLFVWCVGHLLYRKQICIKI